MRYLVSVARKNSPQGPAKKFIWDPAAPAHVDSYKLERTTAGLRLSAKGVVREISYDGMGKPSSVELPLRDKAGPVILSFKPVSSYRPAYLPSHVDRVPEAPEQEVQLRISCGARDHLSASEELGKKYVGRAAGRKAFTLRKTSKGIQLKSYVNELALKLSGEEKPIFKLARKETRLLNERQLEKLVISKELSWWRFNRVAVRPLVVVPPPLKPTQQELEKVWVGDFNKKFAIGCLGALLLVLVLPKFKLSSQEDDKPLPESTLVQLKKPKIIEKVIALKPVAEPSAPVHQVQAQTRPQPKQKPQKKVAQQPPVKPHVDEAALRAAQERAQARAQAQRDKANLAKSLNFLAAAPQAKSAVVTDRPDARYKTLAQAATGAATNNEALSKLAKNDVPSGPIETTGARTMDSKVNITGRKTLNEVQGRVSLSSIGSSGGGDDSALASKGMSVSGDGSLAQSEIERTLSRYLQRFQYCYEKALLSDPNLAGHIMVQWTIGAGGAVSGAAVVQSQLNQPALHQCLLSEISKVRFKAPEGGTVIVKYPFAFSSTPM